MDSAALARLQAEQVAQAERARQAAAAQAEAAARLQKLQQQISDHLSH
ncbi:hypothetical protein [Kitasatospora sp. NPDC058478]